MIRILWFVIGAVVGMIITALISADETVQEKKELQKFIDYEAAMQEIRSYWIDCKKDCRDDRNCARCNDLCFGSIISILDDEVVYGTVGSKYKDKGMLEGDKGRG